MPEIDITDWLWTSHEVAIGYMLGSKMLVQFLWSAAVGSTNHAVVGEIRNGCMHLLLRGPFVAALSGSVALCSGAAAVSLQMYQEVAPAGK
jgi:hypothetical protein